MMKGAMKAMLMSILPAAKPGYGLDPGDSKYWMSVNPSVLSSSSATYCGATQMPGIFTRRMVVVSGGASCVNAFAPPMSPAAVAEESVATTRRRLGMDCMKPSSSLACCPDKSSAPAAQTVVNSPPDGYTLLFFGSSAAINATFYATLPFNLQRDIACPR